MSFPTENISPQHIGLVLRCSRIIRGISLAQLAQEIDLDYTTLSKIERGKRRLRPEIAERIVQAFAKKGGQA